MNRHLTYFLRGLKECRWPIFVLLVIIALMYLPRPFDGYIVLGSLALFFLIGPMVCYLLNREEKR